ncbi:phosphatidylinositol-4- kinase, partial [Dimargaris xerosporica]
MVLWQGSLEFPDLHHQILHQLATTLAQRPDPLADQRISHLWNQFPPLPTRLTSPENDGATGSAEQANTAPAANEPAAQVTTTVLTARQQNALLAGARCALETKSSDTRRALMTRLLPYLEALPCYVFPENHRWKEVSPEDRFVYEFVSYILNVAADEMHQSGASASQGQPTTPIAMAVLDAVWAYLAAHVRMVCDDDGPRVCTFVLPSLNGLLQALEDTTLPFPWTWVVQVYDLAKVLLHATSLDQITQKIAAVRRGPGRRSAPPTESHNYHGRCNGTLFSNVSDPGAWRYARQVLKKYQAAGTPFSSNSVVARYLGLVRNVLVRQCVRPLTTQFHRVRLISPRVPASIATGSDSRTTSSRPNDTNLRAPDGSATGDSGDRGESPRITSRGRQASVAHAAVANLDSAVDPERNYRFKATREHSVTVTKPLDDETPTSPMGTYEDCWSLLKTTAQPIGDQLSGPLADASEHAKAAPTNSSDPAPLPTEMGDKDLGSNTSRSMSKPNGMPARSEYTRAVRGLFVLSQRYWQDIVEVMRETETAQATDEATTTPTKFGTEASSLPRPASNDISSPLCHSTNGTSGINWTAQVSQQSSPPTPTPTKWYLTPELYVLDLLPRCLHIAALACIELTYLDEPFLNATQLFLLSPLARQCPVVFIAVCDVLEVLAVHFPDYRAEILQCAIDYANYPPKNTAEVVADQAGMEKNFPEVVLDDDLLGYVAQVLTRCLALHEGGDEYTLSTLHLFMNTLFSTHWEMHRAPLAHRLCRNAVLTMCDIALALNRDRITVWCVSTMLRAAKKEDVSLRRLIIERLAPVALIAPPTSFHEIIELLVIAAANRSTHAGVEQHLLRETVWQTIRYLAVHANQRPDLYNRFLIGMLQWFVDRGVDIQSTTVGVRTKGVIHAKELGVFLPVIQALLEHRDFQPHLKPTHDTVSSMRNVWFCLVIHGCLVDPSWIEEYNDALVMMAAKSPILVHESAVNYLETDLEYNSVLRRSYTEQSLTSLRQTLATYLPQHASVIRALSFAQTTFLLAVWYIETTRGRAGNCTQILRYFENTGVTSSRLVGLIEAIAEKTIQEYVQERKFQHSSAIVNEEMKSQLRALLISSCNRSERISRLSRTFIKTILVSYPQALLDRQLLFTLLELVQLLWESCQAEIEDEFYPVYSFSSPVLGITLLLPDSMSYRKTLLASFMVAARDWLLLATKAAPLEMEGLLQDYLARSDNTATGFRPHVGRSLALDVGRSLYAAVSGTLSSTIIGSDSATALLETTSDPDDPVAILGASLGWSLFTVDAASGFLFRFGRHMFYQGEQHGWSSKAVQTQASHSVLEDLQGLYQRARQGESLTVDTLYPVLCQAAALVKTPSASRHDVLKLLCWLPVHVFTHDVMKAAITVWTGIIIDQPELEPAIIAELVACWTWTIRHRRGLFAERYSPRNPFCSKMSYAPSDITARHRAYKSISHAFNPHVTWILFLTARVDATQFHHPDTALLMIRFFQLTFPHVAHLNTNSLARQGRFLLVRLGLKLLEGFFASPIVEFQFRKHVYHLALAWFVTPPRWTFSGNKRSISEELRLLMDCYYRVEADLQTESTAGQHVQWIGLNHVPTARGSMAEPNNGRELQSSELPSPFTRFRLKCQKRLLLILLASEIRRLATWNSASDSSQVLKDTAPFKEKTLPEDVWRQVMREAWDYDPRVAVYLPARTSHPAVKQTLTQLVMRYPQAVVNIPEALDYLLPHSADLTVQQRKYLLYWAPVAPVTATS